jgi:hypothetical protein
LPKENTLKKSEISSVSSLLCWNLLAATVSSIAPTDKQLNGSDLGSVPGPLLAGWTLTFRYLVYDCAALARRVRGEPSIASWARCKGNDACWRSVQSF